ncbi:ubiquitin-related modifier 1 homolog isoform X1 [Vespa mandarinia]|uniref:ubiquitin-related modifier 1 homolog isoform X1 n=1 Tax=Vespa mandarinia TaxID=7446 RepID=UPI00161FE223|nr:ubiquitin-related modifier 1 homolog isoform X1 [Vespa mandarinia]
MPSENKSLSITIEFGGGAESLFDKKKKHEVNLPAGEWKLKRLLHWIKDNLLKERLELFMQEDTVAKEITFYNRETPCSSYRRYTVVKTSDGSSMSMERRVIFEDGYSRDHRTILEREFLNNIIIIIIR